MRNNRLLSVLKVTAASLSLSVGLAGAVTAETLADTLADAYEHSGLIERNRAVLRAADEGVAQAIATLRPQLDYTLSAGYRGGPGAPANITEELQTSYGLSADILLFDFGETPAAIDAQKETVLATRQALVEAEQQALLDAVTAFFDVRESIEFIALRESNVRLISEELRAARDRFEVGEVTRTDVALGESRLAEARADLATALGDREIAVAAFRDAVGRAPGNLVAPPSLPPIPSTVSDAISIARSNDPTLQQARHVVRANELNVVRAELALFPDIEANASVSFDLDDSGGRDDSIGLSISGPISQGGRLNSLIREAQANLDESRADLHLTRHAVDEAVEVAYAQLAVARANRVASEEQIRPATVAFRGVREEALLGARTTLDLLDAEQELLDAQVDQLSAANDEFRAAYRVLETIGALTAQDLNLRVTIYDPTDYYNLVKNAPQGLRSTQGEALDRVLRSLGKN